MTTPDIPSSKTSPAATELELVTQLAQDLGTINDRAALGQRILTACCALTHCPTGHLYIVEPERAQYRHLAAAGDTTSWTPPPMLPLRHPLIQTMLGGTSTGMFAAPDTLAPIDTPPPIRAMGRTRLLALPLHTNGHLLACVILSSTDPLQPYPAANTTWLGLALPIAANALAAVLQQDDIRQSQTLMRRTDRLRSLEIIAAGFAHEIRNPLTSIKTFIQLAPERRHDAGFFHDFSRIVLDDVSRIDRLIQEILDYARYKEPALALEDFNELVESCCAFVEKKASSRRIKIEKDLASGLPHVMLDRQQFQQVVLNLLFNAIDAMTTQGGTLTVATHSLTRKSGTPWVQLEIQDTGTGIAPGNVTHIFDPFFTTKPPSGDEAGTGLGLTIAHQIVQEHGGDIRVASTEGAGTTFWINLPTSPVTEA